MLWSFLVSNLSVSSVRRRVLSMVAAAALVATGVVATGPGGESSPTVSAASDGFVSLTPARVLDTRTGSGPVAAGDSVTATLSGIPADAAAAVVNVTAANATGNG